MAAGVWPRAERKAEYKRTIPNITAIVWVDILAASAAPKSAPKVVAISRNIPSRMLEKPSLT